MYNYGLELFQIYFMNVIHPVMYYILCKIVRANNGAPLDTMTWF